MNDDISPYKEEFKRIVLGHIERDISPFEWARLREHAQFSRHRIVPETPDPEASAVDIVATSATEGGMTASEILQGYYERIAIQIGTIERQPVYYLQGEGYYFWGLYPDTGFILDVTITWPAYPPNW